MESSIAMAMLGTVDLKYEGGRAKRTGFALIDSQTIAMNMSDLFGTLEGKALLHCCAPASISGVVAYDAARDIALVRVEPSFDLSVIPPARPLKVNVDSQLKIALTLPVRFEVGPAFMDIDTRIEQVADWDGIGEVLIFTSDSELVMDGSLVIDADGHPVALLNGWGGGDRNIGTPLTDVLSMLRHDPVPLADFRPENLRDDQRSYAYLRRGQSYRHHGDLYKSLSDNTASLREDPGNWMALYERGVLEDMMNTSLLQSERSLLQSIEFEDEWSESLYSLGLVRYKLGKFEEAMQTLKQSARLDSSNPDVYSMLGLSALELGRTEQAFEFLNDACDRGPDTFMYLGNLAYAAHDLGRDEEVLSRFEGFVETHPDHAEARHELASLAVRLDMPGLALKQYQWLVSRSPDDPDLLARLALCQIKTGDLRGASKTTELVEKKQPDHPYLPALRKEIDG